MRLSEYILLFLSKKQGTYESSFVKEKYELNNELSQLCDVFPNFRHYIKNKVVLDFGCGEGYQSLAIAKNGAKYVLGIEINQTVIKTAKKLAKELSLEDKVSFDYELKNSMRGKFDIVISQNSFEHFNDPLNILNEMNSALNPNGVIMITFGPPWFAPHGSHMQFFVKIPWINILFDEKTVMNVRKHFRNDGAVTYDTVEGGLNKMTVSKFEKIIVNSGMNLRYKKYDCIKKLNVFSKIPLIRELFINQISCIIDKSGK